MQNMPSGSDYAAAPRGEALRESRVTAGSTATPAATGSAFRRINVEVKSLRERGNPPRVAGASRQP